MTRPRRTTRAPGTIVPISPQPERIRVSTDQAIGMAVPESLAKHREDIVRIVSAINTAGVEDAHDRLSKYLDGLTETAAIVATHKDAIESARTALRSLLGKGWKDIAEATTTHPILRPMFFNLE